MNEGKKDKIAAGLLALFLGGFGAHRFYLGFNREGVTMLLISIFGFILLAIPTFVIGVIAFVEAIIYLTKSDEEFNTLYVENKKTWF